MLKRYKTKGVAMIGTVAALMAWILLSYGIFTVEGSQFQMMISSTQSLNAQKLAEIDAALIKMVNYEEVTNSSALGKVNLHLGRENLKSISDAEGWQDEIIISNEKIKGSDPDHGRFRVATINIYREGDTEPRFSMQVPVTKSGQTYSRKTIDDFIEALRQKDRELEAKDRQLEAKDRELEAKDRELDAADRAIESRISSMRSSLMSEIMSSRCGCTRPTQVVTIIDPPPEEPKPEEPKPEEDKPIVCPGSSCTGSADSKCGCDDCEGGAACGGKCANGGGSIEPEHTDNDDYKEQDVYEYDDWAGKTDCPPFTAPCDGYIKIVGLVTSDDLDTYNVGSSFSSYSTASHGMAGAWGSDGEGSYGWSFWMQFLADGKIFAGDRSASSYEVDPLFYDGAVTYDGTVLRDKYGETDYDDGDGGSWTEYWVEPPRSYTPSGLYSTGAAISKGSTLTYQVRTSETVNGDASGTSHAHFKIIFIPKK